jgi:hypothetical protein
MSDPPDPRENLTAALVRDYDDEQLVLWIHALQDREEELEAKVKELERRIPDPDDLRAVLDAFDPYSVSGPQGRALDAAAERLRATLEVKDE